MATKPSLTMVVGAPAPDDGRADDLAPDVDRDDEASKVLDSLQEWLDQKRTESELGPLRKPAGGALPGV